jgi:hypothetical protein
MLPYLKGIHLMLDSWRPYRNEEGWKLSEKDIRKVREAEGIFHHQGASPPKRVKAVQRLWDNLEALAVLTNFPKAPRRRVRNKKVVSVFYGFGDASGVGGCTNFQRIINKGGHFVEKGRFEEEDRIHYRYGH